MGCCAPGCTHPLCSHAGYGAGANARTRGAWALSEWVRVHQRGHRGHAGAAVRARLAQAARGAHQGTSGGAACKWLCVWEEDLSARARVRALSVGVAMAQRWFRLHGRCGARVHRVASAKGADAGLYGAYVHMITVHYASVWSMYAAPVNGAFVKIFDVIEMSSW